jgi:hypothetical protein
MTARGCWWQVLSPCKAPTRRVAWLGLLCLGAPCRSHCWLLSASRSGRRSSAPRVAVGLWSLLLLSSSEVAIAVPATPLPPPPSREAAYLWCAPRSTRVAYSARCAFGGAAAGPVVSASSSGGAPRRLRYKPSSPLRRCRTAGRARPAARAPGARAPGLVEANAPGQVERESLARARSDSLRSPSSRLQRVPARPLRHHRLL